MTSLQKAEWLLRHSLTYPALRQVFKNPVNEQPLDLRSLRSVLILRYDRFGDMVVTSPITRHLKHLFPSIRVGVAASSSNSIVARHLPGVDEVHVVAGSPMSVLVSLWRARRIRYDVVLNFILNRTTTGGILSNVVSPLGVKVGQGDRKYAFYFNRMVSLQRGSMHMVNLLDAYCAEVFGEAWETPDLRYELASNPDSEKRVASALSRISDALGIPFSRFVVVNISAGEPRRQPTPAQMTHIIRHLAVRQKRPIILVGAPAEYDKVAAIRRSVGDDRIVQYPLSGTAPFMDMLSLIKRASMLVSPDTSLVHVACAARTPTVAFYASSGEFAEWSPVGIPFEAVFDPDSGVVNTIPADQLIAAVNRLQNRTQGRER